MRITKLRISGFRSYVDQTVYFDPRITVLVGENNTGKSTIALALTKLLIHLTTANSPYSGDDFPYGSPTDLTVEGTFELDEADMAELTAMLLPPTLPESAELGAAVRWIRERGHIIKLVSHNESQSNNAYLPWGNFIFDSQSRISRAGTTPQNITAQTNSLVDVLNNTQSDQFLMLASFNVVRHLGGKALAQHKHMAEFRSRSNETRSESIESLTGEQTASVLLNLKNHRSPRERQRYADVATAFHELFPRYRIEAVENSHGSNVPLILFSESGHNEPLSFRQVSADVHQVLTILTNVVGQSGLLIVLEHPEQHLHPHGMRFLQRLIEQNAEGNQIIVITHDPHFVTANEMLGYRRVWWTASEGTKVCGIGGGLSAKQLEQVKTVLRQLGNREMVFARCVILVEDETHQEFLMAIAPTLDYQLDAHGISVLAVGSEDGYAPFLTIAGALGIPVVCLRDKDWGDKDRYPTERFYSFGMEIEAYLDQHGLAEKRAEVVRQRGMSKRRVGGALGARLEQSEIPPIFRELLAKAVEMATGEPTVSV